MKIKENNKIYLFLLSILGAGVLPYLRIDYSYPVKAWENLILLTTALVGLTIWIGMIAALIFGVLKRKGWTIPWLWVLLYLSIIALLKHILIFGSYGEESRIIASSVIFAILFYFLKNQDVRSQFSLTETHLKSERIVRWINIVIIILILGIYGLILLKVARPHKFDSPIKISLESNELESEQGYSPENIFGWKILIPEMVNVKEAGSEERDDSIAFANEDESIAIFANKQSPLLSNQSSDLRRLLRLDSGYDLQRKKHYEKVGIIFLVLRSVERPRGMQMIYELTTGNLRGFLTKMTFKDVKIYNYLLFDEKDNQINISFVVKSNQLSEEQIDYIITRLKRR